jgi:hypothetical protein
LILYKYRVDIKFLTPVSLFGFNYDATLLMKAIGREMRKKSRRRYKYELHLH